MKTRGWLVWAVAALTIPALSACVDEDAGPTVLTGEGGIRVGFDFLARGLPGGEVDVVAGVVDLDTVNNPTDLFGRAAPSRDPVFIQSGDLDLDATTDWIAARYWFDEARLPLLQQHIWADTYADNVDFWEFQRPDGPSTIDRWDYRSDLDYVGADDSWYAVGLVRYATDVRGLIDHVEILANDGVLDEPDSLFPLGGAPGGYPDHQADFWLASGDFCPPVPANANPFILGHFKTGPNGDPKDASADFDGETDADFCFLGSGQWQAGDVDPLHPDSIPFAPNNFETFNLPQYNYLVIWEFDKATNTVLYDKPHMRAQIGIELDAQGNPIPHAFAPYPTAPGKELSDFAAYTDVLGHPNLAAGASTVTLTVRNLKPLASGQTYQIWLYDEVDGDATKVDATYTRQRPDTLGIDPLGEPIIDWVDVEGPGSASDFSSVPGYRHVIQLRNQDLIPTGVRLSQFTHVVVTIGSSDANPASSPAPVWFRYTNQNGTRTDLFDNEVFLGGDAEFGFRPNLADQGVGWQAFGSGTVQFLNVEAIAVALNRLSRPPLGFYYGVWLVNEDEDTNLFVGEITTPPPGLESLLDADVTTNEFVSDSEILSAGKWATWADLGTTYTNFTHLYVTLEPKDGDSSLRSPSTIFRAAIPANLELPTEREST